MADTTLLDTITRLQTVRNAILAETSDPKFRGCIDDLNHCIALLGAMQEQIMAAAKYRQ